VENEPKNHKKTLKFPIFKIQARSRPSTLVPMKSSLGVLVMISSKSVPIGNCFHTRLVNSDKKRLFKGKSIPLWRFRSRESP